MITDEQKQFDALVAEIRQLRQQCERLLERLTASTNTNLQLLGRVEKLTKQVDRLTDSQLTLRQRLSDAVDQRQYAVDALAHIQKLHEQLAEKVGIVGAAVVEVGDKVDATGQHKTLPTSPPNDSGPLVTPADPWYARLLFQLTRAPGRTQVLAIVLLVIALITALVVSGEQVAKWLPNRVQGETKIEPEPEPERRSRQKKKESPDDHP